MKAPWTARSSNQSILKEINSDYSLGGLMLKLNLQYLGHLIQRVNSLEKTLMLENSLDNPWKSLEAVQEDIHGNALN